MIPIKSATTWRGTADCRQCGIRDMVLFADLRDEDFELIHAPIDDMELPAGQALVRMGETATSLYTLRTGAIKLVRNTVDGRQRIVRVLRSGDVVGLEALMGPSYESDAIALSTIQVCRLPLQVVLRLQRETPRLHQRLLERWHRSLKEADDWLADLNFGTARQRVAGLLLKMRTSPDGDETTIFSREDMGAMLDLKLETVSRTLNALIREAIIEPLDKTGRRYRIAQPQALLQPGD
jgi:CRP/FNR family transcriptional regulator, anaerobic regulatory protein